ncbi:uncharacterized protein LOC108137062 [Drosophila elegans]|uniref:uncharacterized protein LOC108137062 n=1 Tax=Drosophila elegans TaxID=30023 RepID=UPI0007E88277|nr:uncharacterized protein LOC108137062 [Drosophila elegans]
MEVPWIVLLVSVRVSLGHRPLWILEDGLTKRQRLDRPEADYETTTRMSPLMIRRQGRGGRGPEPGPITFLVRHEDRDVPAPLPPPPAPPLPRRPISSLPQRRFMRPHHRLQLPHQYVQPAIPKSRSHRRAGSRHLPVFDNGPGENSMQLGRDNYPIFVYNGTRGELILNTMLSRRRYPMQEPVPGQVLYPPSTPMFRPKPIVQRFRVPGQREMMNLTLIPFYAHEAVNDPGLTSTSSSSSTQPTVSSTTPTPPPPSYETQLPRIEEMVSRLGKRKRKKAKQYEVFHSPQEVMQWQTVLRRSTGHSHNNHRHFAGESGETGELVEHQELVEEEEEEEEMDEPDWLAQQEAETEVELPLEQTETSTTSSRSSSSSSTEPFQIVYIDESLERPMVEEHRTTSSSPPPPPPVPPLVRQSSRYALKREYYAFPVYTLGKLLQNPSKNLLEKSDRSARSSSERESSTWFILNSRYKGPHHRSLGSSDNPIKYYTSKYMENSFRPRR